MHKFLFLKQIQLNEVKHNFLKNRQNTLPQTLMLSNLINLARLSMNRQTWIVNHLKILNKRMHSLLECSKNKIISWYQKSTKITVHFRQKLVTYLNQIIKQKVNKKMQLMRDGAKNNGNKSVVLASLLGAAGLQILLSFLFQLLVWELDLGQDLEIDLKLD